MEIQKSSFDERVVCHFRSQLSQDFIQRTIFELCIAIVRRLGLLFGFARRDSSTDLELMNKNLFEITVLAKVGDTWKWTDARQYFTGRLCSGHRFMASIRHRRALMEFKMWCSWTSFIAHKMHVYITWSSCIYSVNSLTPNAYKNC